MNQRLNATVSKNESDNTTFTEIKRKYNPHELTWTCNSFGIKNYTETHSIIISTFAWTLAYPPHAHRHTNESNRIECRAKIKTILYSIFNWGTRPNIIINSFEYFISTNKETSHSKVSGRVRVCVWTACYENLRFYSLWSV